MVDSCFKVFRKSKCFDKNSLKSHRDSFDSYMANNEYKIAQNNHKSTTSDNENSAILRSDNTIIDHHYDDDDGMNEFECVDQSILRPHNRRTYHYSITSTIASNDMQFSDEDDETLDVLYPLRHNERSHIASEGFDANGMTTM